MFHSTKPLVNMQRSCPLPISHLNVTSRLGLLEVILVDYDVVAASNINRQVLYCSLDVGRRKIDAAVEGLQRDNITSSRLSTFYNNIISGLSTSPSPIPPFLFIALTTNVSLPSPPLSSFFPLLLQFLPVAVFYRGDPCIL